NVFGIISSSVSLLILAFGFHAYLPGNKIKNLEVLLDETDKIFKCALEEGLLPQQEFRSRIEHRLYTLRDDTRVLRSRAYRATTWVQDCKQLFSGLSSAIGETSFQLKELRAEVVVSTLGKRR
ncbi:hypothetical protein F5I97DRAFT_1777765, partial [Phlebopus sp. FC_14]